MESLYKVGDIVTIRPLSIGDDQKYRYGLNDEMVKQSGKTFEIASVLPACASFEGELPDDGFVYSLKNIGWAWVTSMFEESTTKKSTKLKSKKSKTKISFHKKKKLKFNFSL